jgi:hypothetical protein
MWGNREVRRLTKKKHSHTNAAENQILPLLAHSDYITKNGHVRKRYDGKY